MSFFLPVFLILYCDLPHFLMSLNLPKDTSHGVYPFLSSHTTYFASHPAAKKIRNPQSVKINPLRFAFHFSNRTFARFF